MFGYGAREAVLTPCARTGTARLRRPCTADELVAALAEPQELCAAGAVPLLVEVSLPAVTDLGSAHRAGHLEGRLTAQAFACGWVLDAGTQGPDAHGTIRFRPGVSLD